MTDEIAYQQKIASYNKKKLINLWAEIRSEKNSEWDKGKAFEYLILRAFQLEGAEVRWPYSVRMESEEIEQIDGVIYSDSLSCLIECKDTTHNVNIEPIAKLRNQLLRRPGNTIGSIFSRRGFTDPAIVLARFVAPQTILLWNGDEIEYAIKNRYMRKGLIEKYRSCIEQGLSDYNIFLRTIP